MRPPLSQLEPYCGRLQRRHFLLNDLISALQVDVAAAFDEGARLRLGKRVEKEFGGGYFYSRPRAALSRDEDEASFYFSRVHSEDHRIEILRLVGTESPHLYRQMIHQCESEVQFQKESAISDCNVSAVAVAGDAVLV